MPTPEVEDRGTTVGGKMPPDQSREIAFSRLEARDGSRS
jgi:hypothetical protein